jgi:hypothetical protein
MKYISTLILFSFVTILQAQTNPATPNSGFESWTHNSSGYDDPNNWNCLNSSTSTLGFYTCVKDSTPADVHGGKYAARLITMSTFGQTVPGALTTGTINTTNQTISGGLPYTLRPDSIIGWFKYTSVSADNGDCEFYLFGSSSTDTVGEAFYRTPTTTIGTYTRFSYPITYRSSHAVATALWIFSSSNNQKVGKVGSELYIDDIGLVFDTALGINAIINPDMVSVGPNPSNGNISVKNISSSNNLVFTLFDITGRKVQMEKIAAGTTTFNYTGVSEGVYSYSITDEHNLVIKTGKLVIQK